MGYNPNTDEFEDVTDKGVKMQQIVTKFDWAYVTKYAEGNSYVYITISKEALDKCTGVSFNGELKFVKGLSYINVYHIGLNNNYNYIGESDILYGDKWLATMVLQLKSQFGDNFYSLYKTA